MTMGRLSQGLNAVLTILAVAGAVSLMLTVIILTVLKGLTLTDAILINGIFLVAYYIVYKLFKGE